MFDDILGALATPPVGRCRRISSNEQPNWNDSNFDMTPLPPGAVLELPLLEGPGVINHLWLTSHAGGVRELNALSLRIYWDGRDEPGVEAPLGDFFAVGNTPAVVESVPVQVSPTGSLSCYWRMPFAKSARIVITNDNPDRTSGLYWQVDWVQLDALPEDTPYFHARYRQEYPCQPGDYEIARIEGRGKFVGTVMNVALGQDGWFGEGDDFFYIDGESVPSLQGTGTEDYFNDAWGFRPRTSAWFGQPRWQGWKAGDEGICYRWHVLDPVHFEKSLTFTMEHKGNRMESEDAWFIERPDFFSSVALWYQDGVPAPFGHLPPWSERCVPWRRHHLVRSFRGAKTHGGAVSVRTVGFFGGRPSLAWSADEPGQSVALPFTVGEPCRAAVRLMAFVGPGSGRVEVLLDGETVVDELDLHAPAFGERDVLLGTFPLAAGEHTIGFRAHGPGEVAVESLRWLALPPEARREPRNHNEAHFFRLGIGRAAYACRLAYGDLPPTLDGLVERGLMDARYLSDENGRPLRSWRDGDALVVEAAEWTHRVYGYDARR